MVTYRLNDGQVRPAVVVKENEGKADLFVFLTPNDYGRGVHENHVRRGFAQLKDVIQGDGHLEYSYNPEAVPEAIAGAEEPTSADNKKKKAARRKKE